jgi:hypothetical protein
MRTFPVRTRLKLNFVVDAGAFRPFIAVMMVINFVHVR